MPSASGNACSASGEASNGTRIRRNNCHLRLLSGGCKHWLASISETDRGFVQGCRTHPIESADFQPRLACVSTEFLEIAEQVLAGRVINDRDPIGNLHADRLGIARNPVHFTNKMEEVEAHQGALKVQVIRSIGILAAAYRIAYQVNRAREQSRVARRLPANRAEIVPQTRGEFHGHTSGDAQQQIGRDGDEHGGGEDGKLLLADFGHVQPHLGLAQLVANKHQDRGQDTGRHRIDQIATKNEECQQEAGIVEVGPDRVRPPPRILAVLLTMPGMMVRPPNMLEATFETPMANRVRSGSLLRRYGSILSTAAIVARLSVPSINTNVTTTIVSPSHRLWS